MSRIWAAAVAGIFGALALFSSHDGQAQTKELKFANFIPTTAITYTGYLKQWIDDVNAKLGAKYQIKGYWGGVLGRDPAQYSKMVRDGVADIGFVTFGESSNVFPDTTVFELPFLTRTSLEGSLAHWRLHNKMQMAGYDDFHWLSLVLLPPYQFHFVKPFQSLEGLKNRKVRSGGRIQTEIVEALGMTPVSGPVTSAAEALNRGTWDGIFIEWSAGNVFGVHKVAKYHYQMDIASIALGIAMNKQVYESMDADSRKVIDDLSGEKQSHDIGALWDGDRVNVIHEVTEDKEQVVINPTPAELAKAKTAMEPIIAEWVKSSPRNQMVLDNVTQVLNDLRK